MEKKKEIEKATADATENGDKVIAKNCKPPKK
jgi:hypothetical protein